jgi:cytochrome P450
MPDETVLDLSSLDPDFTQNPYPSYATWREEAPVRKVILHGLPAWLVTRSEDIMTVLADARFKIATEYASPGIPRVPWVFGAAKAGLEKHLSAVDPPDHTRLRRLVGKDFTARRVERLRPAVRRITDELIDGFAADGTVELLSQFAYPLAVTVISELLGVPESDRAACVRWSEPLIAGATVTPEQVAAAHQSLSDYLSDLVESKQAEPGTDLLSVLVNNDGGGLTLGEVKSIASQILLAGFGTTATLIGSGMLALLDHPDQLRLLYRRPELTPNAIEEFLRYDAPADTAFPRFAAEDVKLGGVVIRAGDAVLFSLASANRDLPITGDREALDIGRAEIKHLAFAHGIHYCLGAPLARMEGEVAFRGLLAACADLALAGDRDELMIEPSPFTRTLTRLPLTFTARPEAT